MKKLIRHILKEEVSDRTKKFYDYIVDSILNSLTLVKNPSVARFDSLSDMLDKNIMVAEYEELINNPEIFGKYGWTHVYDEEENEDYFYYEGNENKRENWIEPGEFNIEVGYDWLNDLVERGHLEYDTDEDEYHFKKPDVLIKTKDGIFSIPIWWNAIKHEYDLQNFNNPSNRVYLMRQIEKFGVDSSIDMYNIIELFTKRVVDRINGLLNSHGLLSENTIDKFIDFGKEYLSLSDDFKVILTDKKEDVETLGNYNMDSNTIKVISKNRAVPDIIRSIAHEMVHHQQNYRGDLKRNPEEGDDGSPWEDEANAKAGTMVRKFGKLNPGIYEL